jgi:hypothetical protein
MKSLVMLLSVLSLFACSSAGGQKAGQKAVQKGGGSSYQLTNADKYGDVLSLTFATDWPAIQCSAAIDGLKVGSGMGTGLAGVAKVSIRVPAKYDDRRATDFVIECSRY